MPNWCYTDITINHSNEKALKKFYSKLETWLATDAMQSSWPGNWLGNLVLNSGIGTVDTGANTDFRCRGYVVDMDIDSCSISIHTETAWSPCLRLFSAIIKKYLPKAELVFTAEESGNELYSTNDPAMEGMYVLDIWENEFIHDNICEGLNFLSQSELEKYLMWLLLKENSEEARTFLAMTRCCIPEDAVFRKLLKLYNNMEFDGVSLHQYEHACVEDFD